MVRRNVALVGALALVGRVVDLLTTKSTHSIKIVREEEVKYTVVLDIIKRVTDTIINISIIRVIIKKTTTYLHFKKTSEHSFCGFRKKNLYIKWDENWPFVDRFVVEKHSIYYIHVVL